VILYVWVILWAAPFHGAGARACGVRPGVEQRGPARTRQVMRIVGHLLIGGWPLGAAGLLGLRALHGREGTPVLGVPFMWVFLPFVALLLARWWCAARWAIWRAARAGLEDAEIPEWSRHHMSPSPLALYAW
jgi:hypothetical protein